ncbi:MAG: TonB-dependent receptor [Bacteroidaceae bacterium]|nr:TonB-dependent receptor [Bacteroidaceae bacterium]
MKKVILSIIALMCMTLTFAQNKVTGTVVDELGEPVIGATVKVVGASTGVITDINGNYTIDVPKGAKVAISYIGYDTQTVTPGGKVQLKVASTDLNELVVVGYGVQKKAHLTGSVATVKMEEIEDLPTGDLALSLKGMMAGVGVSGGEARPGNRATIRIRDARSLDKVGSKSEEPLYVIDGFVQDGDVFSNLDPTMVESISVLKDASAAVYGARAANGVILVTTKRGKIGAPKISYSGKIGWADEVSRADMLNSYEYGRLWNAVKAADPTATGINKTLDLFQVDELEAMKNLDYNLLDKNWKTAVTHQHSVNLSGATETANYFAGIGYFMQDGNLGHLDYDRWNYRAGTDLKLGKYVKATLQIQGDYSDHTKPNVKVGGTNDEKDYNLLQTRLPYVPEYVNGYPMSAYGVSNSNINQNQNYSFDVLQNMGDESNTLTTHMAINGSLEMDMGWIKPLKGLVFKVSYGKNIATTKNNQSGSAYKIYNMAERSGSGQHLYTPIPGQEAAYEALMVPGNFQLSTQKEIYNGPDLGYRSRTMSRSDSYQLNFFATYARDFGQHHVNALFSIEREESWMEDNQAQVTDPYVFGTGQSSNVGQESVTTASFTRSEAGRLSYIGRLNYAFANKYLFEFLFRVDSSTKFHPNNYWGYFPSVSGGWVISEENWFQKAAPWVDFLKLRASFGLTGRDNLKPWQWMQTYGTDLDKGAVMGVNGNAGTRIIINKENSAVNEDVHWDKSYKLNIGLDFNTLHNRLGFTFDFYREANREMLMPFSASLAGTIGTQSASMNFGKMNMWGYEFGFKWSDKIGKDFKYHVSLNTGYNDNEVLLMDWTNTNIYRSIQYGDRTDQGTWGMQCLGMFRSFQEIEEYFDKYNITSYMGMTKDKVRPGMLIYKDIRGAYDDETGTYAGPDGIVDNNNDQVQLSNRSNPYGFTINFGCEWKQLSLQGQFSANWGGYTCIPTDALKPGLGLEFTNMPSFWNVDNMFSYQDVTDDAGNILVKQNLEAKYPNLAWSSTNAVPSTFWRVSSASVELSRITLAYSLPKKWIDPLGISSVRLNVTGMNLLTFYNPYPDHFMSSMSGDFGKYPNLRKITLGVNVSF